MLLFTFSSISVVTEGFVLTVDSVLSDQSMNIGRLVCVLYFGQCFVLWSVALW